MMYTNSFDRRPSPFAADFFTLGAPVGPDQPNRREDVIKVETILGNTGHHDLAATAGPLGWWGERQEKAVKAWQGENGLKVDGVLKPGGPTIASLRRRTGGLLGGFTPPTPDEVDEHHTRLQQGESGLLNTRPARLSIRVPETVPELDEQTQAFNADTARALTRTSVDGDVPRIYADYLKQAGADGHTTGLDLVEQVNHSQGRDRAERVLHGILGQLPPEQAKAFLGGEVPPRRPLGVRVADLADDDKVPLFARAAAPAAEAPKPVQLAQADTGTKTDAAPADAQGDGQQVAAMNQRELANPNGTRPQLEGGGGMGVGGGPGSGAAIGAAIRQAAGEVVGKVKDLFGQGQQTTVADPQAGKPQVLPGADPSKPQTQQGTPP
ncbi:MAG TPA: peptidoglycan-binding domain-containing protein, partial [Candidatus Omnitrophota bacterium]|nr:peptidoglycan-binding domain-containing protein [Candidatus Omnitrophota bacterium]